jgi:hypothetical protein
MDNIVVGCRVQPLTGKYQGVKMDRTYRVYNMRDNLINIVSSWGHEKWLLKTNFRVVSEYESEGTGWQNL